MRKIVLGQKPKNFKHTVKVCLPNGEKAEIEVSYIYRTRLEVADMLEKLNASLSIINSESEKVEEHERLRRLVNAEADQLMAVIDGWNIGDFDHDSVKEFCDEYELATMDIVQNYAIALHEYKSGN